MITPIERTGDLIDVALDDINRVLNINGAIIAHQVNCKGEMEYGLSKQIREQLLTDEQYNHYQKMCREFGDHLLGKCFYYPVHDKEGLYVANLFAETIQKGKELDTDYDALESSLSELRKTAEMLNFGKDSLGGWPQDVNEGIVTGRVTHLYSPQPGIKIVSIECKARDYTDYIDITCFQRQANIDLSEGDYIAAACVIRTTTNKKDVRLTDQTLLCKDIAQIPEEYVSDK